VAAAIFMGAVHAGTSGHHHGGRRGSAQCEA
jgi:hypothetical protein